MIEVDPKKMAFLIVDDMDNMRRSIRAMLKLIQFGKSHYEATNGKEAWELLNSGVQIDFIISDWNMPKMNGTEFLNLTRAARKFRDIPFLMVTADANQSIVAEAAEQDVDAYLTKPFVTATLEQKIKELLHYAVNPSPLTLLLKKAASWREKGEIDKAIECARKATEINSRSSRPLRELGRLHLKKDEHEQAILCFKKATELNRLDVPSYHYLGQLYLKTGEIEKAITFFTKALELSPRHADRAFKVASLLLNKKKIPEAEKIFKVMLRNNEGNLELHEDVAETCLEHGLNEMAAKCLKIVLKEDPERTYLRKKLGKAMINCGDQKDGLELLEKTAEKFPEDIDLLLTLARSYLALKVRMRADKWATKVIRIDPKNKEAQEILAQCL